MKPPPLPPSAQHYCLEQQLQAQLYIQQCSHDTLEHYSQLLQTRSLDEFTPRVLALWQSLNKSIGLRRWLLLAGLLFGALAMAALLSYSGSTPINLVWLLALFVVLPLGLALTTLALLISQRGATQSVVTPLSLWMPPWLKACYIAPGFRYYMVWLNQWCGFAYSLGGILVFLTMSATQDLAFGWASTFDIAPETSHRIIHAITAPWADWYAQAVPSIELIDSSRFFRWQGALTQTDPLLLGSWWPFILMTLLVYGLLPRLLLVLISQRLLAHSVAKHWAQSPLFLHSQTQPLQPAHGEETTTLRALPAQMLSGLQLGWRVSRETVDTIQATLGLASWSVDEQKMTLLAQTAQQAVVIWVHRAESPQIELLDLLDILLATHTPKTIYIALLPIKTPDHTTATDQQVQAQEWSWQQFAQEAHHRIEVVNPLALPT